MSPYPVERHFEKVAIQRDTIDLERGILMMNFQPEAADQLIIQLNSQGLFRRRVFDPATNFCFFKNRVQPVGTAKIYTGLGGECAVDLQHIK